MKNVQLASEGTLSGLKGYIAISTTYCMGEEVCARGRVSAVGLCALPFLCVVLEEVFFGLETTSRQDVC